MSHPLSDAISAALRAGAGEVRLGGTVPCDFCDADLTADPRPGGFLFQSKAVGPCCADRALARIKGHGEERYIRAYCPASVSFADWVRELRGPDARVRVSPVPGYQGGSRA